MLAAAAASEALLDDSRAATTNCSRRRGSTCEWDTHGLLFVFRTAAAFDHYADVTDLLRDRFAPARRAASTPTPLLKLEPALKPGAAAGGYLYKCDAQLRPDRLMTELRRSSTAAASRSARTPPVTGFDRGARPGDRPSAPRPATSPADAFVVATGAWTPLLNRELGCKLPIVPGKGYSSPRTRPAVCPTYPMIFEEHRVAVSPFASGFRIGSTMEFAGYDETHDARRLQLLRDGAARYLRDPEGEP